MIRYYGGKKFSEDPNDEIRKEIEESQKDDSDSPKKEGFEEGATLFCLRHPESNPSERDEVTLKKLVADDTKSTGGEGTVWVAKIGKSEYAAKIYHLKKRTPLREKKITFMVENPVKDDSIVWPMGLLKGPNDEFVGFLMELVDGERYETIYKNGTRGFCENKTRAVKILINIAHALEMLKENNVVMCDFKFENIFVNKDDLSVKFIDLDGAQVDKFPCLVASDMFNAPETLGELDYAGGDLPSVEETALALERNYHQEYSTFLRDNYSLAVCCYYMLFGRKPYWDIVQKSKHRFPFQVEGYQTQAISSFIYKYAPMWVHLPGFMKRAFYKSFSTSDPNDRLNPTQWRECLEYYLKLLDGELEGIDSECNKLEPEMLSEENKPEVLSKLNAIRLRRSAGPWCISGFSLDSALDEAIQILERGGIKLSYDEVLKDMERKGEYHQKDPCYCDISLVYDVGVMKKIRVKYDLIVL